MIPTWLFIRLPTPSTVADQYGRTDPGPHGFMVHSYKRWWKRRHARLVAHHEARAKAHREASAELQRIKRSGAELIYL